MLVPGYKASNVEKEKLKKYIQTIPINSEEDRKNIEEILNKKTNLPINFW